MAENAGVALDRADAWLAAWRRSPFLVPLLVLWLVREVSVGVVCFIDAGASNASITLAAGKGIEFTATDTTHWKTSMKSA